MGSFYRHNAGVALPGLLQNGLRHMKRIFAMLLSLLMTAALLTACGGQAGLQDGYYTAC